MQTLQHKTENNLMTTGFSDSQDVWWYGEKRSQKDEKSRNCK